MDKETIARYAASLDTLLNKDENGVEFWHARELLDYRQLLHDSGVCVQ